MTLQEVSDDLGWSKTCLKISLKHNLPSVGATRDGWNVKKVGVNQYVITWIGEE